MQIDIPFALHCLLFFWLLKEVYTTCFIIEVPYLYSPFMGIYMTLE